MDTKYFVAKNGSQLGPLTLQEIKAVMQTAALGLNDLMYEQNQGKWITLAEFLTHFRKAAEMQRVERRFLRLTMNSPLLVHDQSQLFKAETVSIGAGGLGLLTGNSELKVGQKLMVHFKPSAANAIPAFNAECEIVNLSPPVQGFIASAISNETPVYGLQFVDINPLTRDYIDRLVKGKVDPSFLRVA